MSAARMTHVVGLPPRLCRILFALAILLWAGGADAQSLEVHGFFDVGAMRFSATDSFDAVFGSPVGIVFRAILCALSRVEWYAIPERTGDRYSPAEP